MVSALFALRLTLPSHLADRGLALYATWVLDVIQNGRWICPLDEKGFVASKPPLYVWLASLASLAAGRVTVVTLFLPGALATLGTAAILFGIGRSEFGPSAGQPPERASRAGLFAALMYLLSYAGAEQVALARPDGVFTVAVTAGAGLALRAWQLGTGWTWFWLAAAAATLAKGPLGLLLTGAGLLAILWERWTGRRHPLRGSHAAGIALFLLLTGGWLALAYLSLGQRLIDRMILGELIGHALEEHGSGPGQALHVQPLAALWTFAPWSLLALAALWRAFRAPAADGQARRAERFAAGWFLVGLAVLSAAPHHHPRHLFPILPAMALLAGRELDRWLPALRPTALARGLALAGALSLAALAGVHLLRNEAERTVNGQSTRELARVVQERVGSEFPLVYVDAPPLLHLFLNTLTSQAEPREAAELLAQPAAVFVVSRQRTPITEALGLAAARVHEVARWPETGPPYVHIVSNHPRLEWAEDLAGLYPPIRVELHQARLRPRRGAAFQVEARAPDARVVFTNAGAEPHAVRVRFSTGAREIAAERALAPGERWELGAR